MVSAAERILRVGVVGVGHLGRHHARIYAAMPGVRLVGVADHDAGRAREIALAHGCSAYRDGSELCGKIDAASVAVPTRFHRDVALTLIEAGVDVLVEKPLAPTLADAEAIVEAAERRSRHVMVGHTERFNPAVMALTREVDRPRFFEIHRLAGFSSRSTDIDVVLDLMIHDLDLVAQLDGSQPLDVDAVGVNALTDRVDIANARIRFASGCVANLTASRISEESVRRVRVFQPRTYFACDTQRLSLERYRLTMDDRGGPRIVRDRIDVVAAEPLGLELEAFVRAVRAGSRPPVDGRQALATLALAQRVRRAIAGS